MAGELQAPTYGQTGVTCYFVLENANGQVWNGTAFATASAVNRNAGAISATEQGTASGYFMGDAPAVSSGVYNYSLYRRLGGSPAETDPLLAASGELQWDGTIVASVASRLPTSGYTVPPATAAIAAGVVAYDIGNGRTVGYFLQGGVNRIDFAADGLTWTVYQTDDTTPLKAGVSTRLANNIGGLRTADPA